MMKLSIIAAIGENRELGKDGELLWHISEDMKRFRKMTLNHPVIVGRKTFESIPEKFRPLPKRENIVLTRREDYHPQGVKVCHNLEDAIKHAESVEDEEAFIIGGGSLYKQTIDIADKLYLTIVEGDYVADTYFPKYENFGEVVFEKKGSSAGYNYKFIEIIKRK
jgi:dihydrofolate reductase